MKRLIVIILIVPALCFGQKDYCKKIRKSADNTKGTITYKSPESTDILVIKQIKTNPFFGLMLHFNDGAQRFEATGAQVEFEDGTIIKDDNAKVYCTQQGALIEASNSNNSTINGGQYVLQGFFHISEENMDKFTSQKITGIGLADARKKISNKEGTAIMNYINCMKALNISE